MAEAKAAPRNQLVDFASAASSIVPLLFGSPKTTKTQTAQIDPLARESLNNIIQSSLRRANSPEEANAMVQDILRRASIAFAPAIAESNKSGLYNNQTLNLLRDQAVADATGAGAKAVLDYQTANQRIAADAAGTLASTTRGLTETSKTAPGINPAVSLGIGGMLAAKTLWNNRGEITDFIDSAFGKSGAVDGGSIVGAPDTPSSIDDLADLNPGNFESEFAGLDSTGFNAFSPTAFGSIDTPVGSVGINPGSIMSGINAVAKSPALGVFGTGFNAVSNYANYDPVTATIKTGLPYATQAVAPGPVGFVLNLIGQRVVNWAMPKPAKTPFDLELEEITAEIKNYDPFENYTMDPFGNLQGMSISETMSPGLSGTLADNPYGMSAAAMGVNTDLVSAYDNFTETYGQSFDSLSGVDAQAVDYGEEFGPPAPNNLDEIGSVEYDEVFGPPNPFDTLDETATDSFGTSMDDIGTGAGVGEGGYGGGDDSSSSSDSIICTELHKQGRLNRRLWIIGTSHFRSYWSYGRKGYYLWSRPSVEHLRKHPNSFYSKFLENVFNRRAHYVAASRGYKGYEKTVSGAIITKGMYALCWLLAVFVCAPVDLFRRA